LAPPVMEVFRRKSCVIAMPMEAKEREVRSQARKVRSSTDELAPTIEIVR
jgi:hypothetical protein